MVITHRFEQRIMIGQVLAVLAVCINNLPLTLLRVTPPVFSPEVHSQIALWGIGYLFLSAGFLAHWKGETLMPADKPWLEATAGYIVSRFLFLALPCYAVYLFDVFLLSFKDFGPSENLLKAAPALLTLSQTWVYALVGNASLGQPLNGANMAWFGSSLFFLAIVYAVTRSLWSRMGGTIALAALLLLLLGQAAQYWALNSYQSAILAYATDFYGEKPASFDLWSYFFEFSPYAHLLTFLAGVALAQTMRKGATERMPVLALIAGISVGLSLFGSLLLTKFLGLNIIILTFLQFFSDANAPVRLAPQPAGIVARIRHWCRHLPGSAYAILILHLAMMLPFASGAVDHGTLSGKLYLLLRVVVVMSFLLTLCVGLDRLIMKPLRRRILSRLNIEGSHDRFI